MANWLQLNGTNIIGWKTGRGVESATLKSVSDAILAQYVALRDAMQRDGRGDRPQWDGSAVVEPVDTRVLIRVSADKSVNAQVGMPVILANGSDAITITLEKMLDVNTVDTSFNGQRIIELENGGAWLLTFANGVAIKPVTTTQSGTHFLLRSNNKFKLSTNIRYMAVE